MQAVAAAAAGRQPWASAAADVVQEANRVLDLPPRPSEPLRITNPDAPFIDDAQAAYTLALAQVITGDERYGRHAAAIVDGWVATTRQTRDTCALGGQCTTSLVLGRGAPGFVFAVQLLRSAGDYDPARVTAFHDWLRSVILPAVSERPNNWGDAGAFMQFAVAAELGDRVEMDRAVAHWRRTLDLIPADGHIPEETRRGPSGLMYTQEALSYKVALAQLAGRWGINLWDARGAQGATLRLALDYAARFLRSPIGWPWHTGGIRDPRPAPFWEIVNAHWPDPAFGELAMASRPANGKGHSAIVWTTLTSAR